MSTTRESQMKVEPKLPFVPVHPGLLQRKCACGQHTLAGAKCDGCQHSQETLQRRATSQTETNEVPPIVQEVLRSSGQPLDAETRAFMEPRFNHDFSQVRVHTDARAGESARAVNAFAYTVGRNVVFGAGQYQPASRSGQHLIGHELTHVIQQEGSATTPSSVPRARFSGSALSISKAEDPQEREADRLADSIRTAWADKAHDGVAVRHHAGPMLNRLAVPIESKAPKSAMTIKRFIELVEAEEKKYPVGEVTNTRLMITRLRKIFYGEKSWDEHLITGAANVLAPYNIEKTETGRKHIDQPGPFNLDLVRHKVEPKDTAGKVPEIFTGQELVLEDGTFLDIGHVLAGLDALNRPNMVNGPFTVNVSKNVDAVTWVGDLGSVLAEAQATFVDKGSITKAEYQATIDEYASPQDMLGNIDAYVIGAHFNTAQAVMGMKVSDILRQYYLGATYKPAREHRYSSYAILVGLSGWDGTNFSNEADWIDDYTDEVNDAATLYLGANAEGISKYPSAVGLSMNQGAHDLVVLYLQALKARIAAEPPPSP